MILAEAKAIIRNAFGLLEGQGPILNNPRAEAARVVLAATEHGNGDAQVASLMARAVAEQAKTIAAQADQIVSLSKS